MSDRPKEENPALRPSKTINILRDVYGLEVTGQYQDPIDPEETKRRMEMLTGALIREIPE
jgi:hypothetical protein